jgi:replicative DNA helicase
VLRSGQLSDDDWTRLARRMGEVSNAPLFIDDSPNMSMMEIRAKCRRLKQRHDLKLVIIDYLQLMSSGKRVESRQQEVSEFSRAIKLLAKELEVPVIAISQLNRGSEQRTDKKPQMSDLRESGCLPASTRILRADTGAEVTLGELFATGARDVPVWSLDDSLRYLPRTMTHVFATGRRQVFELRLASGKKVRATANHPMLTYDGWRPLGELAEGCRIAVPRHVPAPTDPTCTDPITVTLPLDRRVFSTAKSTIASTLWALWHEHGGVDSDADGRGTVWIRLDSSGDLDDVSRLLLRFGISVEIRGSTLRITDIDDQRRFLQEIGRPGEDAARMLRRVVAETSRRKSSSTRDAGAWRQVEQLLRDPVSAGVRMVAPPQLLGRLTSVLATDDLEVTATNDVLWDRVVSITSVGEEDVYDATVLGSHNFVADGVAVHNSIEQDADMVVLLHREELYERESPRAGEADFIVAKHRNGPTATITVAFQGHYSRFVDMAQS